MNFVYSYLLYHDTGIGNIIVNTGAFAQEEGQDIVSLAFTGANETLLPRYVISNSKRSKVIVAVSVLLAATVVVITIILYFLWKWRAQPKDIC
ncbi:hypothetical protein BVRB_8g202180 [Beta vulgaris subsp. vulgaris]|uniref:Uncharacterized protein n=1 Tax=Beta vulgaris subsp. vulgaris TaxID=3555 RepID=A0A0J8E0B4_BETVV|nr:hypothetical protein BVRB_8g202180 [Beta vulgaris subsp. vulgaris]